MRWFPPHLTSRSLPLFYPMGEFQMSKGRGFNGSKSKGNVQADSNGQSTRFKGDFSFVSSYLNDTDREWLDANADTAEALVFELVFESGESFKFSVSFDTKTNRFLATLARVDVGHRDSGKILTGRGATAFDAAFVLAYLHLRKLQDGWGEADNTTAGRWG